MRSLAATRDPLNLAVAIAMIVLGVLLIIGELSVGVLVDVAGIALIVLGVLILAKVLPGGMLIGVVALVVGVLLAANYVPFPDRIKDDIQAAMKIINLTVGIVLLAFGVIKLSGR